jgi:hypothetical protein
MGRVSLTAALLALSLAGCRACSADTNAAPPAASSAPPAPTASVSAAVTAEAPNPNTRPLPTGLVPGSWHKGFVPPVTTPATSSTAPAPSK